ncbi:MAG: amidohydrolase family protein [Chloroflexota bacterium]
MTTIDIIDAHIHYWDPYTTPRTASGPVKLLGRFPSILRFLGRFVTTQEALDFFAGGEEFFSPHLPADYFGNIGDFRVKGVVHIQADWVSGSPMGAAEETAWLASLDRPPLAIVGEAHLDANNLDALLDAHEATSPLFRGVRDMLAHHPSGKVHNFHETADQMARPAFRQGFARLGERDLTFDAFIYSNQLNDLCDLVEAIPQTRIVVDHVATPVGLMGPFGSLGETAVSRQKIQQDWYEGLTRLAQSEHVMMKLSGLFMPVVGWEFKGWKRPLTVDEVVDAIGPHIQFVIDTFGIDRCIFASNFPPDSTIIDFQTYYAAYFKIVAGLNKTDQRKLFHDNAARFYRISGV